MANQSSKGISETVLIYLNMPKLLRDIYRKNWNHSKKIDRQKMAKKVGIKVVQNSTQFYEEKQFLKIKNSG